MSLDMEACMKAAAPGDHHKKLDAFVGKWNAKCTFWMEPGAPPMTSDGVMINEWILGNRFLEQRYEADMKMGELFKGRGLFGYNNTTGQYEGAWIDTMTTTLGTDHGYLDGNTFHMFGTSHSPSDHSIFQRRSTITIHSPTKHTMDMYIRQNGKPEHLCMRLEYTKA